MPSLSEYVRSLRNYNPGITDKSIKIYLLKDGWNIDEIEKTFREINGVTPLPEVSATSQPLSYTSPSSASNTPETKVIEKQPEELSSNINNIAPQSANSIAYPTFAQVQQKVQGTVPVTQGTIVESSIVPIPPVASSTPTTVSAYPTTPIISKEPIVSVPTISTDGFGAPVPSLKPNFSYKDIMEGGSETANTPASMHVPVGWPAVPNSPVASSATPAPIPKPETSSTGSNTSSEAMTIGQMAGSVIPTMTPAQAEAVARLRTAKLAGIDTSSPQAYGNSAGTTPVSTPTPISTPVAAPMRSVKATGSGGAVKMIIWLIVILACIGGLGFAYIKYVHGVYLFVQAPFAKENFISGFAKSIASVDTAVYEASMSFKTAPMEAGVTEIDFDKFSETDSDSSYNSGGLNSSYESSAGIISMIPSDAKFSASISGIYNKKANSNDGKFGMKADYTGDGVSVNVDIESIKVDKNFYVRVNTFPAFFMDLSSVKDKWVSVTQEDLEENFGGDLSSLFSMGKEEIGGNSSTNTKDLKKQYMAILEFANQKQVLEVISDPQKTVGADKRVIYEYEVKPNLNNLIAFSEQLPAYLKSQFGEDALLQDSDPKDIEEMKGEKFAYYFNYYRDHTKILVGVDTKGYPAYIDIFNKTAPKGNTLKKQLETNFRISLSNVNGNNDVVAPENPLPYIDAYSLVTGKSKDDLLYEQQSSRISSIQSAMREYVQYSGTLPLTLEDLKRSTADLAAASSTFKDIFKDKEDDAYFYRYQFATNTRPIYAGSLKNLFASQPGQNITYKRINNSSYEMVYDIKLPSVPKNTYTLMYGMGNHMDTYYESQGNILGLPFVNGVNTATDKSLSLEAAASRKIDTDKDKLSNDLEIYIGTDPNKSDTDGDKKSDYDEVHAGTNPKGTGNWTNN